MEKEITNLRKKLDKITEDLIDLLAKRKGLVLKLAKVKREIRTSIKDKKREKKILETAKKLAKKNNLNPSLVEDIMKLLMEDAKKIQEQNF
jgi:chorismate mutase